MTLTKTKGFYFPPGSPPEEKRAKNFDLRALNHLLKMSKKRKRRLVVQAGGNIGVWPSVLSEHFDLVLTFEPYHDCFHCLNLNCPQTNIIKFQAALGSQPGLGNVYGKLIGSHRVKRSLSVATDDQLMTVEITLDSLRLPQCDALILDVEGYEFRALRGAMETIQCYQPIILIEERRKLKTADEHEPLPGEFLNSIGYRQIRHLAGDGIYEPC